LWRHLAVGGLDNQEARLAEGLKALKSYRKQEGEWRRFPFYYTLLALSEIDSPLAVEEMRYAAGRCERYLKRSSGNDIYTKRRRTLSERVLERC
jgi:hypothetical protein